MDVSRRGILGKRSIGYKTRMNLRMKPKQQILGPAALVAGIFLQCGTSVSAQNNALGDSYAKLLERGTLYENEESPIVQKVYLSGRLQGDYLAFEDENTGNSHDEFDWRRFRFGFKATLLGKFTLHSEADLDLNDSDPLYNRLTDTYISWKTDGGTKIKVGKQSAPFTLDGATSSKKLHTMERSKVADNIWFRREYFTGVTASGSKDNWDYLAGFYSGDAGPEFDDAFEAGTFVLLSLGYNFKEKYGVDNALVRLDFVSNEEDPDNGTLDHETVVSLVGKYDNGAKHLWGDLSFSQGYGGQPDIWGLQIMPFYDINEQSQIIFSYTYLDSDGVDNLRLGRYERRASSVRGNESSEYYFGYNHFFHGHKLKWQTGVQYSDQEASVAANEYDGWGFTTGFRASW